MITRTITSDRSTALIDYAVVGLGVTGYSCVRFLCEQGASVLAMDTRRAPPALAAVLKLLSADRVMLGKLASDELAKCRSIVLSPGLSAREPELVAARDRGRELIGDIELFARAANAPVIAITGTNGKSTVTTLVGKMLEAAALTVRVGGNLGVPALDLLTYPAPDFYVLELSSFQLELTCSLAPRIACVLNITPDHLDRYDSFEDYVAAKARILENAESVVLNADCATTAALTTGGQRIEFSLKPARRGRFGINDTAAGALLAGAGQTYLAQCELRLAGLHNTQNALAALAICATVGVPMAGPVQALKDFGGLEHRAELVAEIAGVAYINDSKATNSGAAVAAIKGLCESRSGIVIAGGDPKGASLSEFADVVAAHMRGAVLIGRAAVEIAEAIGNRIPVVHAKDMPAAVAAAAKLAARGDLVLLAPACASFDMFDDYVDRGSRFRAAVHALVQH